MMQAAPADRLRGITFAKQFPNAAEPLRGGFVAEQVRATSPLVAWTVIAPAPWAPRWLASVLHKPHVVGDEVREGVKVLHPRYAVLPRRLLYGTVASSMEAASRAAFAAVVREAGPQFVHAHALYPSGAAAARLSTAAGLPYVVSIHGSDLYTNLSHRAARDRIESAASGASRVICVSERLAVDAVRELALDPERVVVIPDTYHDDVFRHVDRAPHSGAARLVSVGRLVDVKGFEVLIDAMAALRASGIDATLVIVGGGPLSHSLAARAEAAGVARAVCLAGPLPPARVAERLAAADLYVQPSRREGFGVALVEAMATGLPSVATRSGGPDGIVGEADGILVAPGDAEALAAGLRRAIERLGSFDRAGIAARTAERFGHSQVADRLVSVYREVVGDGGLAR
jgi:teichuronic acid biosynthesis glycosyltransferase TuaC